MITLLGYTIPYYFPIIPIAFVVVSFFFSWICNNRKRLIEEENKADMHRAIVSNNKPIFTNLYNTLLRSLTTSNRYQFFTSVYYDILHSGSPEFLEYFMQVHNTKEIFESHLQHQPFLQMLVETCKVKNPILDNVVMATLPFLDLNIWGSASMEYYAHSKFFMDILESGSTRLIKYYWNTAENKNKVFSKRENRIACLEIIMLSGNDEVFNYLVNNNPYNKLMTDSEFETYCLENRDAMKVVFSSFNYRMFKAITSKMKSLVLNPALFEAFVDIAIEAETDEHHDLMNIVMEFVNNCIDDEKDDNSDSMAVSQCITRLFNYTDKVALLGVEFKQQLKQRIKEQQRDFYNDFNHYWKIDF